MKDVTELFAYHRICPISKELGTHYSRFVSKVGIGGLAKWTDDRIDILAVHADTPGKGQFRQFMELVKKHFKSVYVWEDMNPLMTEILQRYGFTRTQNNEPDGEIIKGWKWTAD